MNFTLNANRRKEIIIVTNKIFSIFVTINEIIKLHLKSLFLIIRYIFL